MQMLLPALGVLILAGMAVAAHSMPYFPGDVAIERAVQGYRADWLDALTTAVSWIGFPPQVDVLLGASVVVLAVLRRRLEAALVALAGIGSGATYFVLQMLVARERPSPDLVHVAAALPMSGFPSGHLATLTALLGFLGYAAYTWLSPSRARWLPPALVVTFVALLSFARIYSGEHWPSDVLAGALVGAIWLLVCVRLYVWRAARPRYSASSPRTLERARGADRAHVRSA
jgi:membrane-associated phospholipid phosphatase